MSSTKNWTYSLPAALVLLAPFDLLSSLGMDIYLPVVPKMTSVFSESPATIQLILSLYLLVLGLSQLLFGPLSDRFGRRPMIISGALPLATSAPWFLALRIAQAAGGGAALVATFATVRDVYAKRPEGVVIYSLLGSMLGFVPAFGPLLGAGVDHSVGWRGIFILLAVLGGAAGLQVFLRWPETRPTIHAEVSRPRIKDILTNSSFWTYTVGYSAALGSFFVYFSTSSLVLIKQIGLSPTAFSVIFGTVALVMIAMSRFTARFVARWGEQGCLIRGMALLCIGALLLLLGQLLVVPSVLAFMGPMWVIAVGISLTCAVTANGALRPFSQAAGTATAIYYCIESLIVTGAGTLTVVLLPADTAWPLIGFSALSASVTLCLVWFFRNAPPSVV